MMWLCASDSRTDTTPWPGRPNPSTNRMLVPAFSKEREVPMALKPSTAKITEFETTFDAAPVAGPEGEVIWADVRIDYLLSGLFPRVTIRGPIPWSPNDTVDQRRSKALRCARELIDHACRASGIGPQETDLDSMSISGGIETAPSVLEGAMQELGLAAPTTRP